MFRHPRNSPLKALLIGSALAGLLLLAGCGEDKETLATPPSPVVNPFAGLVVGSDETLDVMTWNLEHFPKDGETTVNNVIDAVSAMKVDVIALQEMENTASFNQVKNALPGYDGFLADTSGYDINLAFLYRTDGDLEVTAVYEILTDFSRELPRNPLVLECTYGGTDLVIIANHLKAQEWEDDNIIDESDPWDNETRRRDACLLLADYVATNYADKAVIMLGDMNDLLIDPPAGDVFAVFKNDPDEWLFVDMPIALDPEALWSYPGWPSHLDHILIDADLFVPFADADQPAQVVPLFEYLDGGWSSYDDEISDHLPVVVNLKI